MAKREPLPQGQINPAAKPVGAFIKPAALQPARPTQFPTSVPQPRGVQTVSTGGTTMVQGYNSAQQLADALVPFTKQAMQTAETAGLKYVSWRIQKGEEKRYEAEAEATSALMKADEATEVGQYERAAANRRLSAKDPQAGWLMHLLDPYTQIGYQRAGAKIAGAEIPLGMRAYFAQNANRIDPNDGANGLISLQKIRAEYVNQVVNKYGLQKNSPGFQKYVLPQIEKVSEILANQVQEDSVKFFDSVKPANLASELRRHISTINGTRQIRIGDQVYNKADFPPLEWDRLTVQSLGRIIQQNVLDGYKPGESSTRLKEAYKLLASHPDFQPGTDNRKILDSILSQQVVKGTDGKPIKVNGRNIFYTLGQLWANEGFDAAEEGFKRTQADARTVAARFKPVWFTAIANPLEGETPAQAGERALEQFLQEEAERRGLTEPPPSWRTEIEDQSRKQGWKPGGATGGLDVSGLNPEARTDFINKLNTLQGDDFDADVLRQEANLIAGELGEEDADKFLSRVLPIINRKENEAIQLTPYKEVIDRQIDNQIQARLTMIYSRKRRNNALDWMTSESLQKQAYDGVIRDALRAALAEKDAPLTEGEASKVVTDALSNYFKVTDSTVLSEMFPGAKQDKLEKMFPGALAVPSGDSEQENPIESSGEGEGEKKIPTLYTIEELDSIPNRGVELRLYESKAILRLNEIRKAIDSVINGEEIPVSLRKARAEAGAPDTWTFLMKQLEQYPNYKIESDFDKNQLEKARELLLSFSGQENNFVATFGLARQRPRLAALTRDPLDGALIAGMTLSGGRTLSDWDIKFLRMTYEQDKGAGRSLKHYHKFYPELFGAA